MRLLLMIAFLLMSVSCTDAVVNDTAEPALSASGTAARPLGKLNTPDAERYRGGSDSARAARLEMLDRVMDRFDKIRKILRQPKESTWRLQQVWDQLDMEPSAGAERWFVEQMAATVLLETMIGTGEFASAVFPKMSWDGPSGARSIELLLQHRNPNAPLLAAAISRMRGDWDEARVAHAAANAMRSARAWLKQECGACAAGKMQDGRKMEVGRVDLLHVMTGVDDLASLAGRR